MALAIVALYFFNSDGMIFHCALAVRLGEDCGWVVLINHSDIITNTLPLLQHWWSPWLTPLQELYMYRISDVKL